MAFSIISVKISSSFTLDGINNDCTSNLSFIPFWVIINNLLANSLYP